MVSGLLKNKARYFATLAAFLFLFPSICQAGQEKTYQQQWCAENHGRTEYVLPDRSRVDCLTATHAVEFDWAGKWAEGLGQAQYYAAVTGLRGAVALIVGPGDDRYVRRLKTAAGGGIDIFLIMKDAK